MWEELVGYVMRLTEIRLKWGILYQSSFCHHDRISEGINLEEGKVGFGSGFRGSGHGQLITIFVVRQHTMAWRCGGVKSLIRGGQEAKRQKKGCGPRVPSRAHTQWPDFFSVGWPQEDTCHIHQSWKGDACPSHGWLLSVLSFIHLDLWPGNRKTGHLAP